MLKTIKYLIIFSILVLVPVISCDDDSNKKNINKSCKEVVELVEDCMSLHRGDLGYINSCGEVEIKEINSFSTCDEVLDYIKGKWYYQLKTIPDFINKSEFLIFSAGTVSYR